MSTNPTAPNRDSRPVARLALTVLDRVLTATLNQFDRRRTTEWIPAWPDAMTVTFGDDA